MKKLLSFLGIGAIGGAIAGVGILGVVGLIALGLLFGFGIYCLIGLPVWYIWNHVVVGLTQWPHLGFLQVVGLLWIISVVGRALFGHRSSRKE